MQLFPIGRVYDFMSKRLYFIGVSVLLVVASLVLLTGVQTKIGLPEMILGTDFKGGTELEVAFTKPTSQSEIMHAATAVGFSRPDVIRVEDKKNPHRFLIRVQEVSTLEEAKRNQVARALCVGARAGPDCPQERRASELKVSPGGDKLTVRFRDTPDLQWVKQRMAAVSGLELREGQNNPHLQNPRDNKVEILLKSKGDQLLDGLRRQLGTDKVPPVALRVEWIGPKAGVQLRNAAITSVLLSLVFIMAYVGFRFDLRFAPGGVIALAHDAIGTVGVLILLQREINLTTVAALLTIIGFSINDTVVVYDRVRENMGKLRGSTFPTLINVSISEMLGRTALTNGTAMMSLLAFFYRGTGALKDFALALIIGIVLGTYSSVYVALPLTEWLDRNFFTKIGPPRAKKPMRKKATAVV
jgi:preprotein translocase subunit SecF